MNKSGIHPTGVKVLVRPVLTERVSKGGIVIPDNEAEKYDHAGCKAEVVEVGPCAFQEDKLYLKKMGSSARLPEAGDFILMAKYAGNPVLGKDGDYRVINDEDITALLEDRDVGGNANF